MPGHTAGPDHCLNDVQVLGIWNFTLQGDTPLYWLRTGQLEKYLLNFRVTHPCPCTCGFVFHAEVDGTGTDGASFWIERRPPSKNETTSTKRYVLAGDGLESKPIVTRPFADDANEFSEDVEILLEGHKGTVLLQGRKLHLHFRLKHGKGSVGFYNSTQSDNDDVHFAGIRITALRRGPLELDGKLLKRERNLERFTADGSFEEEDQRHTSNLQMNSSQVSTRLPDSQAQRTRSTRFASTSQDTTHPAFRSTAPALERSNRSPSSPTRSVRSMASSLAPRPSLTNSLKSSLSDGALRKTAGAVICGDRRTAESGKWIPMVTNAPTGEQALLKAVCSKPKRTDTGKSCLDFIPL